MSTERTTTTSHSLAMGPPKHSFLKFVIKSQFFTTPVRSAPPGTDLTDHVAIITGSSSGIGLHAARHLLSLRLSHLVMAVRSVSADEQAASKLRAQFPSAQISVWPLEMTSYASVQSFARRVETDLARLDMVILNAGVFALHHEVVPETGHERVVQVNFLSTYLLAILLLPSLRTKSPPGRAGRMTIVGSGTAYQDILPNAHRVPLLTSFDDPSVQPFKGAERYPSSKLLLHLFMVRLAGYIDPEEVVVNICDPGLCKGSGLNRDADGTFAGWVFERIKAVAGRRMEDGAWAEVDAVVGQGRESHGCFVSDWRIAPFSRLVYDSKMAPVIDRLWDETLAEFEFAGVRKILGLD
ncbi:hypothetical protein GE09DRAFT_1248033 [Coniochaeta sp. 2T2.1]|nr:hypothetical protein GE09DRAFT_1248033 [Coniochaeta sp. 2T2.1]